MQKWFVFVRLHLSFIIKLLLASLLSLMLIQSLGIDHLLMRFLGSFKPLFYGVILALFLEPLIERIKVNQKISAILVYIGSLLLIVLLIVFIVPTFMNQFSIITAVLTDLMELVKQAFPSVNIETYLMEIPTYLSGLGQNSISLLSKVAASAKHFMFAYLIAFFISLEKESLINEFKKYVISYQLYFYYYHTFAKIVLQYLWGTFIDGVFLWVSVSVFLYFMKIDSYLMLGFLLAALNLFPYIGAIVGVALIALFTLMSKGDVMMVMIGLVVIQQVESSLVHPLIFNKTMKVHPLYLLLALFLGEFMFGVIGLILSPILASFIQIGVDAYLEVLNQSKVGGWERLDN